jgi:hypothetical protein
MTGGLQAGWSGFKSRQEQDFSPSSQHLDRLWSPASFLSNEHRNILPQGKKQPEREADHSSPSSAEIKNGGYNSTPPYVFMA